jgi:hypothetical protein
VEKAMTLAPLLDREPADAAGARELLGLRRREPVAKGCTPGAGR